MPKPLRLLLLLFFLAIGVGIGALVKYQSGRMSEAAGNSPGDGAAAVGEVLVAGDAPDVTGAVDRERAASDAGLDGAGGDGAGKVAAAPSAEPQPSVGEASADAERDQDAPGAAGGGADAPASGGRALPHGATSAAAGRDGVAVPEKREGGLALVPPRRAETAFAGEAGAPPDATAGRAAMPDDAAVASGGEAAPDRVAATEGSRRDAPAAAMAGGEADRVPAGPAPAGERMDAGAPSAGSLIVMPRRVADAPLGRAAEAPGDPSTSAETPTGREPVAEGAQSRDAAGDLRSQDVAAGEASVQDGQPAEAAAPDQVAAADGSGRGAPRVAGEPHGVPAPSAPGGAPVRSAPDPAAAASEPVDAGAPDAGSTGRLVVMPRRRAEASDTGDAGAASLDREAREDAGALPGATAAQATRKASSPTRDEASSPAGDGRAAPERVAVAGGSEAASPADSGEADAGPETPRRADHGANVAPTGSLVVIAPRQADSPAERDVEPAGKQDTAAPDEQQDAAGAGRGVVVALIPRREDDVASAGGTSGGVPVPGASGGRAAMPDAPSEVTGREAPTNGIATPEMPDRDQAFPTRPEGLGTALGSGEGGPDGRDAAEEGVADELDERSAMSSRGDGTAATRGPEDEPAATGHGDAATPPNIEGATAGADGTEARPPENGNLAAIEPKRQAPIGGMETTGAGSAQGFADKVERTPAGELGGADTDPADIPPERATPHAGVGSDGTETTAGLRTKDKAEAAPDFDAARADPTGKAALAGRIAPGGSVGAPAGGEVVAETGIGEEAGRIALPAEPASPEVDGATLRGTIGAGAGTQSRDGVGTCEAPEHSAVIALAREGVASEALVMPGARGADSSGAPRLKLRSVAEDAAGGQGVSDAAARDLTLSVEAVEAEGGTLYVAGSSQPGALVRVYVDDIFVGEARTGTQGRWLLEAKHELTLRAGALTIRAEQVRAGSARVEARAEVPFIRRLDAAALLPAARAGSAPAAAAGKSLPVPEPIIIRRGDTLWKLARRAYGRGLRYTTIYGANADRIRNPDLIFPGQVFVMPVRDRNWEARRHKEG